MALTVSAELKDRARELVLPLTGIVALVVAALIAFGFLSGTLPWRSFESARWKQVVRVDDQVRLRMADSLIRWGQLYGLTREQVIALLGPDSDSGYFDEWDLVYWLGDERSLIGLDSEWLVVRFGPSGTVSEYRIVTD